MVHVLPRTKNTDSQARIGAQFLPGSPAIIRHAELLSPRQSFHFRTVVPQTSCIGNGLGRICAGFSRPGSGSARRSGRGVCGHRSRSQQPGHGRMGPARQRGGRMEPRRWGVRESPGAFAGNDGSRHGREAVRTPHRREECHLTPKKRPGPPSHQDGIIRPRHERLLPEARRLVVEDPEPFVPERVNGADRVHRDSLPSPPSPRESR